MKESGCHARDVERKLASKKDSRLDVKTSSRPVEWRAKGEGSTWSDDFVRTGLVVVDLEKSTNLG